MALEDTWFFVILASCLMLTLGALLSGLVYLRLHGYGKIISSQKSWWFISIIVFFFFFLIGNLSKALGISAPFSLRRDPFWWWAQQPHQQTQPLLPPLQDPVHREAIHPGIIIRLFRQMSTNRDSKSLAALLVLIPEIPWHTITPDLLFHRRLSFILHPAGLYGPEWRLVRKGTTTPSLMSNRLNRRGLSYSTNSRMRILLVIPHFIRRLLPKFRRITKSTIAARI